MAKATLRTFSNVKSSAITPRQPSVPKRIVFTGNSICERATRAKRRELEQFLQAMLLEPFHHAPHILCAFPGTDQKRIGSFHHNQIRDSYSGDELRGAPDEISACIESEHAAGGNVRSGAFGHEFVNSSPGTDIAP